MTMLKKVTLADVAKEVGVSAITISRALHNPEKVSEALRERIQAAVDRLGYIPNAAARALASRKSDVLGVIIPSITNNVFSDVLRGIYNRVEQTQFDIQLGSTRYFSLKEEQLIKVFLNQQPAGLIVTGVDQSPVARKLLKAAPCPVVQIMEIDEDPVDMMVGFSHYEAAAAATRHLLEQGYQHPGFLAARMDPRTIRRYHGFRDVLQQEGEFQQHRVITTKEPSRTKLGAELLNKLCTQAPEADAVLCNNDDIAVGVLFEAQRCGITVPEFGICGFNDMEIMSVAEPSLSSVRTFRYEMGVKALELLLQKIAGEEPEQSIIDLGFKVEARCSTRRNGL